MDLPRRTFLRGTLGWAALMLAGCGGTAAPAGSSSTARASAGGQSSAPAKPGAAAGSPRAAASAAASAQPSATGAANQVEAAWVAITANQMIWPLALEAGYFEKYGVNFSLEYVQGSLTAAQALQARDLDMIEAAGSAVVGARAAKTDLVMTAGFLNDMVWRIMAIPSITSVDQLKGATVAISKVGNADYFAWSILAKHRGWQASDFKYASAGNPPGQAGRPIPVLPRELSRNT